MDKIALVTGGGTGLGKGMALALSRDGWTVVISGRRQGVLEAAAAEISAQTGRSVTALVADVGEPDSVRALFAVIKDRFGRLDLLVNNAGMSLNGVPMEDITFEDWSAIVSANLTGPFLCTQEAMRLMKAQSPQGGRIINNGSISAHAPRPNSAPYTATKHAVTGLTKATSLDGRAFNITCGQIDIGNAETNMVERMRKGVLQPNGDIRIEPTMAVEDVARAVVYMASLPPEANVLTMTVMAASMPFVGRG